MLSRLLGLVRESAQAAAFGVSGLGDIAVLMLTFPDWLTGVLASGALAYVLLPHWACQTQLEQAASQRRVARTLLAAGTVLALLIVLLIQHLAAVLAPGLPKDLQGTAAHGLAWSAVAIPAALLGALWSTRLQHARDLPGVYAANLVINGWIIVAMLLVAWGGFAYDARWQGWMIAWLGGMLLGAMLLRLAWLRWRIGRTGLPTMTAAKGAMVAGAAKLPSWQTWAWAMLAAGLPLTLPFVARSLASQSGEGVLASFNYAWKLVELPLVLAIQLVASLTFPAISRAFAHRCDPCEPLRSAFALSWTLACAAVAALQIAAPAIAQLLFGWGRMDSDSVARIAHWGAVGAWSLLPQALIAVGMNVLAAQRRMQAAVAAYSAGLAMLLLIGTLGWRSGAQLMWALNGIQLGVSLVVLVAAMGARASQAWQWLPWQTLFTPLATLMALALVPQENDVGLGAMALLWAVIASATVLGAGWLTSPSMRAALRR